MPNSRGAFGGARRSPPIASRTPTGMCCSTSTPWRARDEGEDWIWSGGSIEPSARRRAILRLSRGGSDAVVLREFDLDTRVFLPDGFVLPEAKGGISWLDPDTLPALERLRRGYGHDLRLCADCSALASGAGPADGRGPLRNRSHGHVGFWLRRPDGNGRRVSGSSRGPVSSTRSPGSVIGPE